MSKPNLGRKRGVLAEDLQLDTNDNETNQESSNTSIRRPKKRGVEGPELCGSSSSSINNYNSTNKPKGHCTKGNKSRVRGLPLTRTTTNPHTAPPLFRNHAICALAPPSPPKRPNLRMVQQEACVSALQPPRVMIMGSRSATAPVGEQVIFVPPHHHPTMASSQPHHVSYAPSYAISPMAPCWGGRGGAGVPSSSFIIPAHHQQPPMAMNWSNGMAPNSTVQLVPHQPARFVSMNAMPRQLMLSHHPPVPVADSHHHHHHDHLVTFAPSPASSGAGMMMMMMSPPPQPLWQQQQQQASWMAGGMPSIPSPPPPLATTPMMMVMGPPQMHQTQLHQLQLQHQQQQQQIFLVPDLVGSYCTSMATTTTLPMTTTTAATSLTMPSSASLEESSSALGRGVAGVLQTKNKKKKHTTRRTMVPPPPQNEDDG